MREYHVRISAIYNGCWYGGRPTVAELHRDLREVMRAHRPDFDLSAPGLCEAWDRGEREQFLVTPVEGEAIRYTEGTENRGQALSVARRRGQSWRRSGQHKSKRPLPWSAGLHDLQRSAGHSHGPLKRLRVGTFVKIGPTLAKDHGCPVLCFCHDVAHRNVVLAFGCLRSDSVLVVRLDRSGRSEIPKVHGCSPSSNRFYFLELSCMKSSLVLDGQFNCTALLRSMSPGHIHPHER
jgi:hypothetical protein